MNNHELPEMICRFPVQSPMLKSLSEVESERREMEVA